MAGRSFIKPDRCAQPDELCPAVRADGGDEVGFGHLMTFQGEERLKAPIAGGLSRKACVFNDFGRVLISFFTFPAAKSPRLTVKSLITFWDLDPCR